MSWEYQNVEPSAMPPCPWCRKADAVERDIARKIVYRCRACLTRFEARWSAEPDAGGERR
jgi:hypothetical protein